MEHRAMGRYRRLVIAFAVALLLIGAYGAAGFLAVPYYARKFLQDFVRTHYARVLGIGEIHFNPFTLTLDVRHLVLPDADGQTLLSFERLHVDLQLASLWRFGPSFRGILLEQPYVRAVIRPNGALNLADLGKGFPAEPARAEQKSAPLRLSIGRLAVISGTANFEDRTRPTPFRAEFKPIAFELRDFSTTRRTENDYALNAVSPEGERLICSGTLRLEPLASHGVFEISDLKARTVWNYLRASLPFEIDSGMIGIKGDYDLGSAGGPIGLKLNVRSTTLRSLGIKPKGAAQNSIDVARIEVDETRIDLTKHSVEVAKVTLAGGDIKAWLSEQGRLNLLDLGGSPEAVHGTAAPQAAAGASVSPTPAASAAAPVSSGDAASAWSVSAPDLTLQGFKVSAEDRQMRPAAVLLLSPLNIHVAGFNTSPEDILDITLDAGVNTSGKINARAKVTPKSGAVSAHVEAADLGLTMLQPYIARYTSMTLLQGALGSRLDIERQADGTLAVKGNSHVADLRTVDNALKQDFIKWKDLRVADILYLSKPASLRIGSITALEPYVRMIIAPDRTLNVKQVLTPPGAVATGPAPEAERAPVADPSAAGGKKAGTAGGKKAPAAGGQGTSVQTAAAPGAAVTPFPVSIGTIRFVNGSANYTDLWIKPSFAIGIRTLGGTVSGLSSDPRSRAKVQLDGKVERYSPIQIAGQVNLLSAALYTDLKVSFRDLDLTVVNPYAGYFAGYRIDKGKLSVDVSYRIEQRKLTAAQHFLVDQLQLGERVDSADATHLPLKLAVALLKDRNGVIDLDLPMSGSLDDPTFSIGPILWKMFVNLIVKAATAPFALLGHLFGGGEHVNVVEFHAGSAELDQPAKEQLAALAKALKERPQLNLDIPVVFSKGLERPQIAAMRLREELLARVQNTRQGRKHPETAGELALADPAKHFSLLLEQYHADLGKDAPLPPTAVAVQQAKGKEAPPYDPAIADLNAALIDHIQVPDSDLEALGKQRAQAIRDALVSAGQIEPTRLFIVNAPPKPDSGDTVKVEMAVK
ncbi:MAG TPA: DUF748 domain-containing protein [Steroidobacteraceae bacterium]|nr:DUF748 domain-containing protein [Steroidobacteraceae bacterium]